VEYKDFEDEIGVPALQCSDLLDALNQLPGREVLLRLYRYTDVIIHYLNGNPLLANKVKLKVDVRNDEIDSLISRKRNQNDDFNTKFRKLEYICNAQVKMLNAIAEVERTFNNRDNFEVRNDNFHKMKQKFYKNVESLQISFNSEEEDDDICAFEVNTQRKNEILKSIKKTENLRSRGKNELKWTTIIGDLGFENRWKERVECGRLGAKYKQSKGNDKSYGFKSKQKSWVFYEEDRPAMEEIVRYVYRPTNTIT